MTVSDPLQSNHRMQPIRISVGEGTAVSAALSIFNDGVKPSCCAIDPIRLRKEG